MTDKSITIRNIYRDIESVANIAASLERDAALRNEVASREFPAMLEALSKLLAAYGSILQTTHAIGLETGDKDAAAKLVLEVYGYLGKLSRQMEAAQGHSYEAGILLEEMADRMVDVLQKIGKDGGNLSLLLATGKGNLKLLIRAILTYGPELFQEVVSELSEDDKLRLLGQ